VHEWKPRFLVDCEQLVGDFFDPVAAQLERGEVARVLESVAGHLGDGVVHNAQLFEVGQPGQVRRQYLGHGIAV